MITIILQIQDSKNLKIDPNHSDEVGCTVARQELQAKGVQVEVQTVPENSDLYSSTKRKLPESPFENRNVLDDHDYLFSQFLAKTPRTKRIKQNIPADDLYEETILCLKKIETTVEMGLANISTNINKNQEDTTATLKTINETFKKSFSSITSSLDRLTAAIYYIAEVKASANK